MKVDVAPLDPRLNAYRKDLADSRLRGKVDAENYCDGEAFRITSHFADIFKLPDEESGLQAQVLYGHDVTVFERTDGWSWAQSLYDGYVGYIRNSTLTAADGLKAPTHLVSAPRTFLYPQPDLKKHRVGYRSIGSKLTVVDEVTTRGTDYAILDSGEAVIAHHLIKLGSWENDPVSVAERLMHTPYLWGGNSGFGIDCSGLVSLANMLCGNTVLRDSDMQANSIGVPLETDYSNLQRGDLVFWNGHVGMMVDPENMLHTNGNTMNVALEKLSDAIERIGYLYDQPIGVRRP